MQAERIEKHISKFPALSCILGPLLTVHVGRYNLQHIWGETLEPHRLFLNAYLPLAARHVDFSGVIHCVHDVIWS